MLMFVKFICSIILSLGGALAIANIEDTKIKIGSRQIIFILILSVATYFFSGVSYKAYQSILMFAVMTLAYKEIFRFDFPKSIIMTAVVMLLASIGDLTIVLFAMKFVEKAAYHTDFILLVVSNIYTAVVMYLLTKIKPLSHKINILVNKTTKNKLVSILTQAICSILLLFLVFHNIFTNYHFNFSNFYNLFIYILVGIILAIYIAESNNYNKLLDEYDRLIETVQTFEDWIEDEQLELHESKNSLSAIYEMTDLEEVHKEINKILKRKSSIEDKWVTDLKPIPKGGLKGLLYYKFMVARNNKIKLIVDISNDTTSKLKKLTKENSKVLLRLIGIYFDNAIESAAKSKKKNVSLEIYKIKKELHVVITNTYDGSVSLDKVGEKNFSTKGKNRGKGTYLAKKLVNKNKNFEIKNSIINNYYIQRIIIK